MSLQVYTRKRNFSNTPEPFGRAKKKSGTHSFVVQRHDASRLHYDFRLQVNGVLKSWAIPKGPSMNPTDKRLAVMVEDHPLAYGKFEGEIPEGNYGAGTVEIWDHGTYESEDESASDVDKTMAEELKNGSLKFILHGKKLKGSFALVKMKNGDGKNWLLIKHRDAYATDEYDIEQESKAKRKSVNDDEDTTSADLPVARSVRSSKEKVSDYIKPTMAYTREHPFNDDEWIFEIKWDGYRAIAEVSKKNIKFYSRNGLSFERLYPVIAEELKKIKEDVVLDGEVVVLDKNDRPSFQKLQHYSENRSLPLVYYVFDCLRYKGKDITDLPLLERKKIAAQVLPESNVLKYSDHVAADGKAFFENAVKLGLEGIIAKRAESKYAVGRRTYDWLKIKNHNTQEAVIAGYTEPRGSRRYFGALVLGMYEKGKLKYIGHTGTGFTEKVLKDVYTTLQPAVRKTSPFEKKVPINAPVTWVEPVHVCAIKYTEVTEEGILRHPVFMGLRIDKKAKEVDHLDVEVQSDTDMKTSAKKTPAHKTATKKAAKKAVKRKTAGKSEADSEVVKVQGHELKFTHLDKIYWPDEGITKGEVIDYYNSIHKYILPYLKDRPQSLKRNPNGIRDKGFFHKDAGDAAPAWVDSIELYSDSADKEIDYIICNNKATLLYLNNLGCIEINPWNSRVKSLDNPDYLVMDIDPSDKNTFEEVIDTARAIKDVLDKAGAVSFCKTSGASGLHVYVPLGAKYDYEQARSFAEIIASLTREQLPDTTTMERSLNKRKGKIYLDYLQNKRGQTLASVYSLRPVPGATISTPLDWKEVKHGLSPSQFTMKTLPKRLAKKGDIFKGILSKGIDMAKCLKRLEA